MKSLAPASNRMTETDTMILQMWYLQNTSNTITQLARNWSYHYTNTHKTARLLMHMCIPSIIIPDHAVGAGLPVGQEEGLGTRLA